MQPSLDLVRCESFDTQALCLREGAKAVVPALQLALGFVVLCYPRKVSTRTWEDAALRHPQDAPPAPRTPPRSPRSEQLRPTGGDLQDPPAVHTRSSEV